MSKFQFVQQYSVRTSKGEVAVVSCSSGSVCSGGEVEIVLLSRFLLVICPFCLLYTRCLVYFPIVKIIKDNKFYVRVKMFICFDAS